MIRRILSLVALMLAAAAPARADGLVQLTFSGDVYEEGGHVVSLQLVRATLDEGLYEVDLTMHLGYRTTAHDLAALLAQRLRKGGFEVIEPRAIQGASSVSIFVDAVRLVRHQVGGGLGCTVTSSEEAPAHVRVTPPPNQTNSCSIRLGVSHVVPLSRERGMTNIDVDAGAAATASWITEQLVNRGISAGLVCSRPQPDSWCVDDRLDGGQITGCSVQLFSDEGWTVEVALGAGSGGR